MPHSNAPHSVCISLGCYHLPDLFTTIKTVSEMRSSEELTSRSTCSWPRSTMLSFHVHQNEKDHTITLSPPLLVRTLICSCRRRLVKPTMAPQVTPDQCVDISAYMRSGCNTVQLRQYGDLSEYAFVFHAHHPTKAQLAELSAVQVANEKWKQFIESLRTPVATTSPWRQLSDPSFLEGSVRAF